jgi:hypothetical protein
MKALKDEVSLIWGNAGSIVSHGQEQLTRTLSQGDHHFVARLKIPNGIAHQVVQDGLEGFAC